MCCRASPGTGRTHIQVRVSRDERDFPRGLNTRMHHVPRPDPVLYILVLRSRYTQPRQSLQRSRIYIYIYTCTYIRMRNKYPWTNCLRTRHTAVGPIRFNSTASLPLRLSFPPSSTVLSFFFFHPVSISDLHDPLTPWRTIDPRLTLLGVVSLSARPLSSPLSPLPPFPPLAFMQPDEGSRSSRIQFRLLSNYH